MARKKKKTTKKSADTTALATVDSEFVALQKREGITVGQLISDNLGGEELTPFDLDRVKAPSGGEGFFSLPGLTGSEAKKEFEGVIVFSKRGRGYWENEDPDNSPPDCSSDDGVHGVGGEADECGGMCADCPFSKFGSASKGQGQACKESRSMFVFRTGDMIPLVVQIPPTSLGNAKKFLLRLANFGKHYSDVVTKFSLKPSRNDAGQDYQQVVMEPVAELSAAERDVIKEIGEQLKPTLSRVRVTDSTN